MSAPPQIPNLDPSFLWPSVQEGSYGDDLWIDFVAKNGTPIPLAALTRVELTSYDAETGFDGTAAKVRNGQVLILDGVIQIDGSTPRCAYDPAAVDGAGHTVGRLTITTVATDTVIRHPNKDSELYGFLFWVTHTGGKFPVQAALPVENLRFVVTP